MSPRRWAAGWGQASGRSMRFTPPATARSLLGGWAGGALGPRASRFTVQHSRGTARRHPPPPLQGAPSPDAAEGRELIAEVCEVVESSFSDARGAGFDREAWQRVKEKALARPLRDRTAAYG